MKLIIEKIENNICTLIINRPEQYNALNRNLLLELDLKLKSIEKETNHDVKAVEYFLQEKIRNLPDGNDLIPFIHFACTSEDINNISYALMLKDACESLLHKLNLLINTLRDASHKWSEDVMLSRTHGQPASFSSVQFSSVSVSVQFSSVSVQFSSVQFSSTI